MGAGGAWMADMGLGGRDLMIKRNGLPIPGVDWFQAYTAFR